MNETKAKTGDDLLTDAARMALDVLQRIPNEATVPGYFTATNALRRALIGADLRGLPQRIESTTDLVVEQALGPDVLGAALMSNFPEARSGDESPDMAEALRSAISTAVRRYVTAWTTWNVPTPLTLAEAVAALINARSALREAKDTYSQSSDALGAVQAALNRAPMTEDDLPRP